MSFSLQRCCKDHGTWLSFLLEFCKHGNCASHSIFVMRGVGQWGIVAMYHLLFIEVLHSVIIQLYFLCISGFQLACALVPILLLIYWQLESAQASNLTKTQTNNHSNKSTPKRDSHPCFLKTAVNSGADPDLQHAQVQSVKLLGWKSASQTLMPQCFARKQRIVHCTWGESSSVFVFCPWQWQHVWNCVFSNVDSWYSRS